MKNLKTNWLKDKSSSLLRETGTLSRSWLLRHTLTVFSCVLIVVLGIAFLSHADPVTTTIGENIATNDLSVSGNVTSGTWQGTAVGAQYGGTGADWSAVAQGNLPYFSAEGILSNLAPGTAGQFLKSQGTGADPEWANVTRSATFVVAANDSSTLSKQQADYVCDGTDDQVQIQAAIDALPSGGGKVVLMEGIFNISDTINLDSYQHLAGYGYNSVITTSINTFDLIYANTKTMIRISDLRIQGANSGSKAGIHIYSSAFVLIDKCYITTSGSNGGIYLEGPVGGASGNHIITNNVIRYNNGYGIYCSRQHDNQIIGNRVEGNNLSNIYAYLSSTIVLAGNEFAGSVTKHGIYLNICSSIKISDNWIDVNELHGIYLQAAYDLDIIGNTIAKNGNDGIYCTYVRNSIISNNNIFSNSQTLANTYDGIHLHDQISSNIITHNQLATYNAGSAETNQRYGIYMVYVNGELGGGTGKNRIAFNQCTGNVTGGIGLAYGGLYANCDEMYNRHSDLFMDILSASTTAVHAATTGTSAEQEVTTAITNPDVARNISITTTNNATPNGNVTITGVDAKGNSTTEDIAISAGGTAYGSKAFATVSKITIPAGVSASDTVAVGISDKLGLSNIIYASGDVYKVKKNNADATIGTVNTIYGTVDCASITGGDDFTIYYKSNLNIIN